MTSTGTVGTVAATLLGACVAILLPLGMSTLDTSAPVHAQQLAPSPVLDCPPAPDLSAPLTEIVSDGKGRVRGTIVLADGRISMRVRPEVSELTNEGSVRLGGFTVPALTTRRAETTVELGSGQSFMIAGLLRNHNTNDITKAPFLGDLPILGSLFRSTNYRHDETELVVIVTPYLVRPVSHQLATPIDGYRNPDDAQLWLQGQTFKGQSGAVTPTAIPAPPAPAPAGAVGAAGSAAATPGFKL